MTTFAYPCFKKFFINSESHFWFLVFPGGSLKNYTGKMTTFAYPLFQKIFSSTSGHTFGFWFFNLAGRSPKNYTGKMVTFAYPLFQKIFSSTSGHTFGFWFFPEGHSKITQGKWSLLLTPCFKKFFRQLQDTLFIFTFSRRVT
jgi:hypothetical protein